MNRKSYTKDEKFMLRLHEKAQEADDLEAWFDSDEIAQEIGEGPRAVKNTINLLTQSNFIKKDGVEVCLTPHGLSLIRDLLS